ncbi:hypothetical protein FOCC_FOCC015277 [Frankliniella occidentalis]|nr:hypothetical protein FOCC_FOCC015277 [Frankliniella occidentalis]
MVKFDNYAGPGIRPKGLVPIPTILRSWSNVSGNCSRQQSPLVPAYSCKIHKSQGLTLDKSNI